MYYLSTVTLIVSTAKEREMNSTKILELLEDGATFDALAEKFFHPSFRKGWVKLTDTNISWVSVTRKHGDRLAVNEGLVYSLTK